jgi:hypothetical protein
MKIEKILTNEFLNLKLSKLIEKKSNADFNKFLKEATLNQKIESFSPLQSIYSINFPSNLNTYNHSLRLKALKMGYKILENLENYQKALEYPGIKQDNIKPLIESLFEDINQVSKVIDCLPTSDPLRKILIELGIISTIEVAKFEKGEYF